MNKIGTGLPLGAIIGGRRPKNRIMLTQAGREKLDSDAVRQRYIEVVSYLKEHGISSIHEIAKGIDMPFEDVKRLVNELSKREYQWVEWIE